MKLLHYAKAIGVHDGKEWRELPSIAFIKMCEATAVKPAPS